MKKEYFDRLKNPPVAWHTTDKITPCGEGVDGKKCGKITEYMYPFFGGFSCEDHRGTYMGMGLCCSNCFEPYWPSFPERAEACGEKYTGHCGGSRNCCHARDQRLKDEVWQKEGDGALKSIELSISAEGRPMIVVKTERNHYTIYYNPATELFRGYSNNSRGVHHFKLKREIWYYNASERINIVSFFNGTRDVSKEGIRYEDDSKRNDYSLHEIEIPPHLEGSGRSCDYGCIPE